MNGFNLSDIIDANLGGTFLSAIYLGSTKLWPTVIDYSQEYLTIKSLADNNTISFNIYAPYGGGETKIIYWSSNKTTWHSVSTADSDTTIKTLSKNEKIYIKGSNNNYGNHEWGYTYFNSDYEFNISGNIMSLIYGDNFIGQTTLPSTSYIFTYIFVNTKVVDASNLILPATTLVDSCYYSMFSGCTSLTTAPELPATTLADSCYCDMFEGCSSLTTAPELPATTLVDSCYQNMFYNCTSLSYIKMLATDISATLCLDNWVANVAATGTFVKDYNLKSIPVNSASGIPVGWTIEELNVDYSQEYFTIESLEDNNAISFNKQGSAETKTIYWSSDKTTWHSVSSDSGTIKTLSNNEKIYIKGSNNTYASSTSDYNYFNSDAEFNISGNIMSLIYGDNFIGQTTLPSAPYIFDSIFRSSKVVDASNLILPATTLADYCYGYMFGGCTSLTAPPELPATKLADSCYRNMFRGCTSLTAPPELPATTLAGYCYGYMFRECTSLTAPPELSATTLANNCYQYMFYGCTNLTTAPELSATTLATSCYAYMFHSCTSLTAPPELSATTLAKYCYQYMFHSCTSLTAPPELPATILANGCYAYMFEGCSSLTTAPELPATTLAASCYMSMFSATKITAAPTLPATTLADSCYRNMFYGCSSLATAPVLPATTLQPRCYQHMFFGCSSLTTSPELPATTLVDYCYGWMFQNCTSLSYIKCLATNISASYSHSTWLYNVAATGTFVKPSSMTSWTSGISGIPSGWTVVNI